MPLVQRLRDRQRGLGGKAELAVGLALQRRQVEKQRRQLRAGLCFLADFARLALAGRDDRCRFCFVPQALGAGIRVLALFERLVEPAALVLPGLRVEGRADLPVVARHEAADFLLAFRDDRQRRRLHTAHRRQIKTAFLAVKRGHRARAVDADQPVGLRAAARRVRERQHLVVAAQRLECLADRRLGHRLQPQPPHRLPRLGRLHDVAEDELALAPGVAGVDQFSDVLALDQLQQHLQARLRPGDRCEIEVRRNHRQVREGPLAAFDVVRLRRPQLEQVPHRGRQHEAIALVVVLMLGEAAQRARDVGGDGRLLGDDQSLGHWGQKKKPPDYGGFYIYDCLFSG